MASSTSWLFNCVLLTALVTGCVGINFQEFELELNRTDPCSCLGEFCPPECNEKIGGMPRWAIVFVTSVGIAAFWTVLCVCWCGCAGCKECLTGSKDKSQDETGSTGSSEDGDSEKGSFGEHVNTLEKDTRLQNSVHDGPFTDLDLEDEARDTPDHSYMDMDSPTPTQNQKTTYSHTEQPSCHM